ncbi:conserved hypothetical protein [Coccidioides posadasii str. Silveira]|uniref:Uncharacterized protein n=2 Tax=Coccidioides posadasii TaxID=199306 RepID=E9CZN9_COCPS|nr:conserved hypothetical protein [Coccidioides posadasii str. Silveira]KMM73293.1 hypothetical protein CPAG_09582 [Coccidioides posadasii RMSCC 3488]
MVIWIPFPIICFQCGTDQNPCRCKFVGPTLGTSGLRAPALSRSSMHRTSDTEGAFPPFMHARRMTPRTSTGFAVGILSAIICYPASLFCGCWATKIGARVLQMPVELNAIISQGIPF